MPERFWNKVNKVEGTCWLWTGVSSSVGYGRFCWRERATSLIGAHRVSWMLTYGDIPDGLFVLHKCDVKLCVNPDHLWLGTNADNIRDAADKGLLSGWSRRKGAKKHRGGLSGVRHGADQ
jgi:hypothetical protein